MASKNPSPVVLLLGALALVAVVIGYFWFGSGSRQRTSTPNAGPSTPVPSAETQARTSQPPSLPVAEAPAPQPAAPPPAATASLDLRSAEAQRLIALFEGLTLVDGRMTPDQAALVKDTLRQIVLQGNAALPAIRQYLQGTNNTAFGRGSPDSVGVPTLRAGLIQALSQIGGPEAQAIAVQVMQNTTNPQDVAQVARNLEQAQPGQHTQQSVDTARAMLNQALAGNYPTTDIGPLIQVVQTLGGTNSAGDFAALAPNYGYYASIALASLPSGQGISELTRMAQGATAVSATTREFAMQMLAQVSSQYPDAASALVNLAQQNQLSDTAWKSVADALTGTQFQFAQPYPDNMFGSVEGDGLRTYRLKLGNQSWVSTVIPLDPGSSAAASRLAIINQLLALNPGPTALQALQDARAQLTGPK
jgi:hypothetical protein